MVRYLKPTTTLFACALALAASGVGCGGKTEATDDGGVPNDGGPGDPIDTSVPFDSAGVFDTNVLDTHIPVDTSVPVDSRLPIDPGDGGVSCSGDCLRTVDPLHPPARCPPDSTLPACKSTVEVSTCPTDTACMAVTKQSGDVLSMRISRLRLWAPDALLSLSPLAIDPPVAAQCQNKGGESLNWLLQIDNAKHTLRTGGARPSADHKTWSFSADTVAPSAICPGVVGPSTPIDLRSVTTALGPGACGTSAATIDALNIPVFESPTGVGFVLPMREVKFSNFEVSADNNCIGSFDKKLWCDGDSLGWTTGGVVIGKISVEDSDHVPVRSAGCQSLCAILANDASKVSGKVCRRDASGKIVSGVGNTALASGAPAFTISMAFAAYGITIAP